MRKLSAFNLVTLVLGITLLYLPIAILIIFSFNASRLVAVWGGWSTRWYAALAQDAALLQAASISFRIAFIAATFATILGTLAAVALVRFGDEEPPLRRRGRGHLAFPRNLNTSRHPGCAATPAPGVTSFLRHPGLAPAGENRGFGQGAELG